MIPPLQNKPSYLPTAIYACTHGRARARSASGCGRTGASRCTGHGCRRRRTPATPCERAAPARPARRAAALSEPAVVFDRFRIIFIWACASSTCSMPNKEGVGCLPPADRSLLFDVLASFGPPACFTLSARVLFAPPAQKIFEKKLSQTCCSLERVALQPNPTARLFLGRSRGRTRNDNLAAQQSKAVGCLIIKHKNRTAVRWVPRLDVGDHGSQLFNLSLGSSGRSELQSTRQKVANTF